MIPDLIDPQLFVDGKLTAMFVPYTRLELGRRRAGDRVQLRRRRVRDAGPPQLDRLQLEVLRDALSDPAPLRSSPARPSSRSDRPVGLPGAPAAIVPRARHERAGPVERQDGSTFPKDRVRVPRRVETSTPARRPHRRRGLDYLRVNLDVTSPAGAPTGPTARLSSSSAGRARSSWY